MSPRRVTKDQVRAFARRFIATRADRLDDIREAWRQEIERMSASDIVSVHGRRVWDSRGKPTVEAEVTLAGGARGRAIAPAGASTGSGEAVDLRDGGSRFGGADVTKAVANVNGEIAKALAGRDARDQAAHRRGVDRARRHAQQGAARRQRHGRHLDGGAARRGRRRRACRSMRTCLATSRR